MEHSVYIWSYLYVTVFLSEYLKSNFVDCFCNILWFYSSQTYQVIGFQEVRIERFCHALRPLVTTDTPSSSPVSSVPPALDAVTMAHIKKIRDREEVHSGGEDGDAIEMENVRLHEHDPLTVDSHDPEGCRRYE